MHLSSTRAALAALALAAGVPTCLSAATTVTTVNADLLAGAYTVSFMGGTFTFGGVDSFPNYLTVATGSVANSGSVAAIRTVFGSPSTDFPGRGTVIYDQNTLGGYASFASPTTVGASNGDNLLGLSVTSGGQTYYGFAFTTNARLNSYGFETAANTGINPETALATAAVPEPASWGMMIVGFGAIGAALRRRKTVVRFA